MAGEGAHLFGLQRAGDGGQRQALIAKLGDPYGCGRERGRGPAQSYASAAGGSHAR
ncbi:hypothetical protein [Actinoplanes sp. L3-i22]|uniref:hypothetical protein n=1 Tax=Actinoplanes sp. L3-i22 TaxID=2836373 RepID=UPI001C8639A4|nr:hypothetical protein [Actinoplanes sp. L3-i22]